MHAEIPTPRATTAQDVEADLEFVARCLAVAILILLLVVLALPQTGNVRPGAPAHRAVPVLTAAPAHGLPTSSSRP